MSRIVLMGSGETAPTMVRLHRRILSESGPGNAVILDTPFGFQANADDLVAKTAAYFADSVGTPVTVASWRRRDIPPVEQERSVAALFAARWAFAGPGSPSYALRQWIGTAIPDSLADVVRRGGTLCLGSAAAVIAGRQALPVYEIYKAGADPHWLPGLDLLGTLADLSVAVVPHYDNNEGGHYDTRFCYMGEVRIHHMEQGLTESEGILGIDEHTAVILDLSRQEVEVHGSGAMTVRVRGASQRIEAGSTLSLADLRSRLRGESISATASPPSSSLSPTDAEGSSSAAQDSMSLRVVAARAQHTFDSALSSRDVDAAASAVLDLEQQLRDWQADTQQGDDDVARRHLRAMIASLSAIAHVGAADPRERVAPFVELLIEIRANARTAKDFATSDLVRDRLTAIGVEVRDTPEGAVWSLRQET